jgi:hypothetical protein
MKKGYVAKLLFEMSIKTPNEKKKLLQNASLGTVVNKITTFLQASGPDKCFNYAYMTSTLLNFQAVF